MTEATTSDAVSETTQAEVVENTEPTDPTDAPVATDVPDDRDGASSGEPASIGRQVFSTWTTSSGETFASAAASLRNDSEQDLFGTEVTFDFFGADGTPVATESTSVNVIPAGDTFPAVVRTDTDLTAAMPVTLEITVSAGLDTAVESEWVELELGVTAIVPGDDFATMSGTVTNPSDESVEDYQVVCLIKTPESNLAGGAFAYPDRVDAGQTIAWEVSVEDGPMQAGGLTADCRSIVTLS
ncbi:MAG TPA: hypothetical protein VLN74_07430 [Ilumatobacteraceae bacterium]|nr:hypothetical protein [Ilumatobacteraceae bacterium]